MLRLVTGVALAVAAGVPAAAQNVNAEPNYGTVSLKVDFQPDPHHVQLRAGGDQDARRIGGRCTGFVTSAPDVRLNYQSGNLPLMISVAAGSDTTLVINAPDGTWHCDDDSGNVGMNPLVRFNRPQSGRYEIWVGTYASGATQPARLSISEVYSE